MQNKKPNTSFIKKCLFLKRKTEANLSFFLKSAKKIPLKALQEKKSPLSFSPYFLKKVQIFSVKKLVDKFCECRHRLLTQVFQIKKHLQKLKKKSFAIKQKSLS